MLLLDSSYARPPGDAGHVLTWRFPVRTFVVRGVSAQSIATATPEALLPVFAEGIHHLVEQGVVAVATTCGFLASLQAPLAAMCPVPLATSALLQIPSVERLLPPGRRVGVLASQNTLERALTALGLPVDIPVQALSDDSRFLSDLRQGASSIELARHRADVLDAAHALCQRHPDVGALVLECANFPPHSHALREATGLPVFDTVTLVNWLYASVCPPTDYPG